MNFDLTNFLDGWSYDPSCITARKIMGNDGTEKVQLRLDLGLFQMEMDGRPDGTRPKGYGSLLEYYRQREVSELDFADVLLDDQACADLQQEAVQYYYRYLCMYALNDLPRVIRDTSHNLELFDFITRNAEDEDTAWQFLQFYTEVKTMNTRAHAEKAAGEDQYDLAVQMVQQGLADVQRFWKKFGEDMEFDESLEDEDILRELLQEMQDRRPKTREETISDAMNDAIEKEDYEKAAQLRDQLNNLPKT